MINSDIEYVFYAATMERVYSTYVAIKAETVSGAKVIAVYSHGHRSMTGFSQMPHLVDQEAFREAIRQMVEANKRAEVLPPRIVTEPWTET